MSAARTADVDSPDFTEAGENEPRPCRRGFWLDRRPDDRRTDGVDVTPADLSIRVGLGAVCSDFGNGLQIRALTTYIRSVRSIDHGHGYGLPDALDADRFSPGDPGYERDCGGWLSERCVACDDVEAPYQHGELTSYPLCAACLTQAIRDLDGDAS